MNKKMDIKKMVLVAILVAIGIILHTITPALGLPMQPDFAIAMLFIIVLTFDDYKTSLISAIILGIFTALTTKFPSGQIPNIVDKLVTVHVVYGLKILMNKISSNNIKIIVLQLVGTLVSGSTFLGTALVMGVLPGAFGVFFMTIVLPTVALNTVAGFVLYRCFVVANSRTKYMNLNK